MEDQTETSGPLDDSRDVSMELLLSRLLRSGVVLAGAIVLAGGIVYLAIHGADRTAYGIFQGQPPSLSSPGGILRGLADLQAGAVIQFGLLVLIATPVMRVLLSAYAFARVRDALYVFVTLVVFAILMFSLLGGRG
jgi:uncharacterized membrane protein